MTEQEHALIVARVSSLKQREEDQRPELLAYSEQRGYAIDHVEQIHAKSAYTGKNIKQMMAAVDKWVKDGEAVVVVFRDASRFSRIETEAAVDVFRKIREKRSPRVRIEFVAHGGEVPFEFVPLLLKGAHEESKRKSAIKLQGNTRKRAKGELVGRVSWGYDPVFEQRGEFKVQVGIVPSALGREWIPRVFAEIINGKSTRAVCEMLKGIPSPQRNSLWNDATVRRIVASTTYYGVMPRNPNLKYEALVSVETHKAANAAIDSRNKRGRGAVKHEPALVRPYCGACWGVQEDRCPSGKSPMYIARKPPSYAYYSCRGHGPARKSCGADVIPVHLLDAAIERVMSKRTDPYMKTVPVPGDDNDERLSVIEAKIEAATKARDWPLVASLSQEAEAIPPSVRKSTMELVNSGQTVGENWQGLSLEEKRDELTQWTCIAYPDGTLKLISPWKTVE